MRIAVIVDTHGRAGRYTETGGPFPATLDFTDLFAIAIGALFLVLWPFWLLAKLLGVRWVVVIERDGHEVGRELVRGWNRSKRRVNEILHEVTKRAAVADMW